MADFLPDVLLGPNQFVDRFHGPLPGLVVGYRDGNDLTRLGHTDFHLFSNQIGLIPLNGIS